MMTTRFVPGDLVVPATIAVLLWESPTSFARRSACIAGDSVMLVISTSYDRVNTPYVLVLSSPGDEFGWTPERSVKRL